jgi:hypothetical protein
MDRREFLRHSAAAGLGLGLAPLAGVAGAAVAPPRVRRSVRLGRTGIQISDIGFGSSRLAGDEALGGTPSTAASPTSTPPTATPAARPRRRSGRRSPACARRW